MRKGIALALLVVMLWTTTALAYGGRACACDPDPPRGGIGGPGAAGGQTPGLGGAGAGRGWVQNPGGKILLSPETVAQKVAGKPVAQRVAAWVAFLATAVTVSKNITEIWEWIEGYIDPVARFAVRVYVRAMGLLE